MFIYCFFKYIAETDDLLSKHALVILSITILQFETFISRVEVLTLKNKSSSSFVILQIHAKEVIIRFSFLTLFYTSESKVAH